MNLAVWLLLVHQAILSEGSEEVPLLQEIFVPKNLNENQAIKLNCDLLHGKQPVKLAWLFKGKKLDEDSRIKIKTDEDSASLVIRSLTIDDLGEYECVASNQHGQHKRQASVFFNAKPVWTKAPRNVTSSLNQKIVLECDAKGHPPPELRWVRLTGQRMAKELKSGMLQLELTKDTAGLYRCSATNSMGSIERTVSVGYLMDTVH